MRKDYVKIESGAAHQDETAFVAGYWTNVWRQAGGPSGIVDRVARKEEYRLMRPYIETLPKGARLLDGGCGLGEWTAFFSRQGYPTLGLDLSVDTVAQLGDVFPDQQFAVGDIRATGLADASFDGYFSWGTFEHFEEGLDPCLREAYRVLKPGGYLFMTTPFDNLRHALGAAFDLRRSAPASARGQRFYQWRLGRAEMRSYLANNGFEVLDLRPIAKRQGLVRVLWQNFGLHYDRKIAKALAAGMAPFVWSGLVAHMLMGIARKPAA